jgi:hypothetical protein
MIYLFRSGEVFSHLLPTAAVKLNKVNAGDKFVNGSIVSTTLTNSAATSVTISGSFNVRLVDMGEE